MNGQAIPQTKSLRDSIARLRLSEARRKESEPRVTTPNHAYTEDGNTFFGSAKAFVGRDDLEDWEFKLQGNHPWLEADGYRFHQTDIMIVARRKPTLITIGLDTGRMLLDIIGPINMSTEGRMAYNSLRYEVEEAEAQAEGVEEL